MNDWDYPLPAYWDQQVGAINRNVQRLACLNEPGQQEAYQLIREAVARRIHALNDSLALQAAVSLVDDLYKFVNEEVLVSRVLFAYLEAVAGTFTRALHERGYVIHYIVENQYSGIDFLLRGPFELFPRIFNAAGFVYVCPQQLAFRLMQADGIAAAEYSGAIARYIDEARILGDRLVSQCQETGRHFAFLEADCQEGSLDAALRGSGGSGVLSIFRNEAPVPGSSVAVTFPEHKLEKYRGWFS